MGTFLLLCIIGVVALMVVGTVVGALIHALFWIVTLPFRIFFKLLFGLGGLFFGLLLSPFVAVLAVIAIVGAVLSLLTPLLPVLLLGLFGWGVYRLASKKPSSPPPPQPGFWR
jgi:hypothetical protein